MTRSHTVTTTLTLALLAAALPIAAQEEPAGRFAERIRVTEVLLDVLVTDADGNVVVGLNADDFVVEEQGKPVRRRLGNVLRQLAAAGLTGDGRPPGAHRGIRRRPLLRSLLPRSAPRSAATAAPVSARRLCRPGSGSRRPWVSGTGWRW